MTIGIDIRNIGKKRTGDEVVFFNVVKSLAEIDNKNKYLLFTDVTDKEILAGIKKGLGIELKNNFKIVSLKSGNKFIWNIWTLPRYLRQNPVDIYHTQYVTPFFVSKKIKIITTIHDISFNYFPQFIKWPDLFFLKILIPVSLKRADKIIAVSNFTRDEIIQYYKIEPGKVSAAHNAIADNFLADEYSDNQLEKVRKKYDLPEKFILYIGTMQPRKNLPFLIEAYAGIKNKLFGTRLVIAGKKSRNYDPKIDEVISRLNLQNAVIFPGYIDEEDKPILFKLSHIFVFPSLYEGFGIPILEAMSRGTPVIASDIPGLREVGEKAVLYFNPRDLASLKNVLYNSFVDNDSRKKLIESGLKRSRFFSWKNTAEKIINVYQSVKIKH